ncbi:hypothetical protein F5Y05DRAFT_313058 [Hypoxylon sp. FL0543]|nr:hypothetical protein F5Y05DRAFT_313058 [Hypoxylon sp. FL0543]
MADEDSKSILSSQATLVSRGSIQTLATTRSSIRTNNFPIPTSIERNRSQTWSYGRLFRRKRHYHIRLDRRNLKSSSKPSGKRNTYSRCLSAKSQGGRDRRFETVLQRLSEMDRRQEQILAILRRTSSHSEESPELPSSPLNARCFQPNFDVGSASALQKYIRITLQPDPAGLCDMFLARYNLPHILTGSYDPIESLHMHGWEQEGCGDVVLVVQESTLEGSRPIELPWNHIDQSREQHLAHELTRVAPLVKERWSFQARSIRDPNEVDVPFETNEISDSILFLNCPGNTKTLLYQAGYDSYGAHFAREPWLSGKRSLLCQLQVITYL